MKTIPVPTLSPQAKPFRSRLLAHDKSPVNSLGACVDSDVHSSVHAGDIEMREVM
jgi:hypothetical protein